MLDLDKLPIEVACPRCHYPFDIAMLDARLESRMYCPNCKSQIRLHDNEGSVHVVREHVQRALNQLAQTFRNLGK
jgi:transcription initiation factor IIE alpha subunit